MPNEIIKISHLKFKYEDCENYALDDISLTINEGEFFCIMGPTGAGKSTLCNCLNGLIPNSIHGEIQGSVKIFEKDTQQNEIYDISLEVGITFQDPESQIFGMSVEEDLAFGPENICLPVEDIKKRIDWVSDLVDLKGYLHRAPWTLSGGQKQRVSISSGLTFLPKVMVFDEPVSELDPIGKSQVFEIIHELNRKYNITIILIEHNAEEIADHADRIMVMDKGKIKFLGTPKEVFKNCDELMNLGLQVPQVTELQKRLDPENKVEDYEVLTKLDDALKKYQNLFDFNSIGLKDNINNINTSKKPVIVVKNVHQNYKGEVEALKGVNLKIYPHDFLAVIGQNGSGKSTLVKHFNGLLKPNKGEVYINAKNTKEITVSELAQTVSYTFQNPDHQIFANTVYQEIAFGLENLGFAKDEIDEQVNIAIKEMGLLPYIHDDPYSLGKGLRQKVALASSIAMNPDVLIIDEPTTGLDYGGCVDVMEKIVKLHEKGRTIICITHEMWLVAEYASRVVVMQRGNILFDGTPRDVFSEKEILNKAFLTPPQITRLGQKLFSNKEILLTMDEFVSQIQSKNRS